MFSEMKSFTPVLVNEKEVTFIFMKIKSFQAYILMIVHRLLIHYPFLLHPQPFLVVHEAS